VAAARSACTDCCAAPWAGRTGAESTSLPLREACYQQGGRNDNVSEARNNDQPTHGGTMHRTKVNRDVRRTVAGTKPATCHRLNSTPGVGCMEKEKKKKKKQQIGSV